MDMHICSAIVCQIGLNVPAVQPTLNQRPSWANKNEPRTESGLSKVCKLAKRTRKKVFKCQTINLVVVSLSKLFHVFSISYGIIFNLGKSFTLSREILFLIFPILIFECKFGTLLQDANKSIKRPSIKLNLLFSV